MNEKKRVFHVELQFFPGFHESELLSSDMLLGVERNLGRELEHGEFDYAGYERKCCERFCEAFKNHAPECVEKVSLERLSSPREYNFSTDKVYARVTLSPGWRDDVLGFMRSEKRWLRERIWRDFTDYDGYMSFLSNDMDEWVREIEKDDPDPRYVSRMLGYMMFLGDKQVRISLVMDTLDDMCLEDYVIGN